jgi:hypothetical protein
MTYRPITDTWILTRCRYKTGRKRYGGYPGGFPERARALLGVTIDQPVLHVCGGLARLYPYPDGFGPNDKTLDLDPNVQPDYLQCVSQPLPAGFAAMLADPPYSSEDAARYPVPTSAYPNPHKLMAAILAALPPGHRAGMLHCILPRRPPKSRFVALVSVAVGFGNRVRTFTVFERVHASSTDAPVSAHRISPP